MTKIVTSRTTAASEYRAPGSNERFVGNNGEINASSKKDLLSQSLHLMEATAKGVVGTLIGNQRHDGKTGTVARFLRRGKLYIQIKDNAFAKSPFR